MKKVYSTFRRIGEYLFNNAVLVARHARAIIYLGGAIHLLIPLNLIVMPGISAIMAYLGIPLEQAPLAPLLAYLNGGILIVNQVYRLLESFRLFGVHAFLFLYEYPAVVLILVSLSALLVYIVSVVRRNLRGVDVCDWITHKVVGSVEKVRENEVIISVDGESFSMPRERVQKIGGKVFFVPETLAKDAFLLLRMEMAKLKEEISKFEVWRPDGVDQKMLNMLGGRYGIILRQLELMGRDSIGTQNFPAALDNSLEFKRFMLKL